MNSKKHWVISLLMISMPLVTGCALLTDSPVGLRNGALQPCPQAPRCVSSMADGERHAIAALQVSGPERKAWQTAVATVAAMPRTTIVTKQKNYLHAEVISPWHVYTDDLELLLQTGQSRIDVRSSGRVGYYDFEVNRDRVEALRAALAETGVVKPASE